VFRLTPPAHLRRADFGDAKIILINGYRIGRLGRESR